MGRKLKTAAAIGLGLAVLAAAPLAAYLFPSLLGADEALIVLTGSMEPTLSPGDIVLVEPVTIDQVEVGDIVNFHPHASDGRTFTHRVVEKTVDTDGTRGTVLTTQGDANEDPDPMAVNAAMLQGRVSHVIPFYGKVVAQLQAKLLYLALVVVSLLAIGNEVAALVEGPGSEPRTFRPEAVRRSTADEPTINRFEVVGQR